MVDWGGGGVGGSLSQLEEGIGSEDIVLVEKRRRKKKKSRTGRIILGEYIIIFQSWILNDHFTNP